MNFIQILKRLETYSMSLPYVNDVSIIDIYEFLNGKPNVKYACVNINIEQSTRNDNLTSYSIVIYYTDRLTEDKSNVFEIWTTTEQVLNSIINYAAQIGDVDDGWTIKYYQQQFADNCAGGWINFNLEVPSVLGDCLIDEYEDDEEKLIERLKEAIRQYEADNAELALLLKEILHKISGEVID